MSDARSALDRTAVRVLGGPLSSAWRRLAPLSAGAVASGAVIASAGALLRGALGHRARRLLGWAGAAALLPIGLWLLWTAHEGAPPQDDAPTDAPDTKPHAGKD